MADCNRRLCGPSFAMDTPPNPASTAPIPVAVWLCPTLGLALAVAPMPYGYYTVLRIIVCLAAFFIAWLVLSRDSTRWLGWAFAGLAILYNPIIRVHLDRDTWAILNVLSIAPFAWAGWRQRSLRA